MSADPSSQPVVLVVEDQALLRLAAVDMLEEAGFQAIEASGSSEAVAVLERRSDIRIVFTDIDMPPGIDGVKLAALVRDRWPPVEIIITSGQVHPPQSDLPERTVFFPKPYRSDRVIETMRAMAA